MLRPHPTFTLFPYTTLFRSQKLLQPRECGHDNIFICTCGTILQRGHFKMRSEEHTSELQSRGHLVCRLLLEKKKPMPPVSFDRALATVIWLLASRRSLELLF